jgi:MFS family permease
VLLRQRNYALLWLAGLVSLVGDWVVVGALPFYVYERSGSPLATAGMLVALSLPHVLLGSVAGVFVDRWDRRRAMVACDVGRALALLPLLAVPATGAIWLVYVVGFLEQSCSAFFGPAKGALLPRVVARDDLVSANALASVGDAVGRLVGPSLGGALLYATGLGSVVLVDSASYLASAALLALMALPPDVVPDTPQVLGAASARWREFWEDWRRGLGTIRADRTLAALLLILGIQNAADSVNSSLIPTFVRDVLGGDARAFGWLLTAQGVGGLAGGLLIARVARLIAPVPMLAACLGLAGVTLQTILHFPYLALVLPLVAAIGFPAVGMNASAQGLLQGAAPDAFRGRVLGAFAATQMLLRLLGYAAGGAAGDALGAVPVLEVAYSLWLVAALLVIVLLRPCRLGDS